MSEDAEKAKWAAKIGRFSRRLSSLGRESGGWELGRSSQYTAHQGRQAVPPRTLGCCQTRSSWFVAPHGVWVALRGSQLLLYMAKAGAKEPPPGAQPYAKLELVGADLAMQKHMEFTVTPTKGAAVTLAAPDEQQRDEWMVGLAAVEGLHRRVADYYLLGRAWGQGATCQVQECVSRFTGRKLALKTRREQSQAASKHMHNELHILKLCAKHPHPAIPRLVDYFYDLDGRIELVMELMEGGELFSHIAGHARLPEAEAAAIFSQVASGVAHLHSLGIAHRDLKCENIMYQQQGGNSSQVKIMDYDLAKVDYAPEWEARTPVGSLHYMAPEVVEQVQYGLKIDCWSLGAILFILLSGRMPFDGDNDDAVKHAIRQGQYSMRPEVWQQVSPEAKDLLERLLELDSRKRAGSAEVLQHPWLVLAASAPPPALPAPVDSAELLTSRELHLRSLAQLAPEHPAIERLLDSAAAGGQQEKEDPLAAQLRACLQFEGTAVAGGLQDGPTLRAAGLEPPPASPR